MKKRLNNLSILLFSFPLIFLQCSKEEAVVKEPEAVEEEEKDVTRTKEGNVVWFVFADKG